MEGWEQYYNSMLSDAAKATGWSVVYDAPTQHNGWHVMRLVCARGDDPQEVACAGEYAMMRADKPLSLAREMRLSGKWELGREWPVPVETRLGALMWLNRRHPATSHELPDAGCPTWRTPQYKHAEGDWGLTLEILWINKVHEQLAHGEAAA